MNVATLSNSHMVALHVAFSPTGNEKGTFSDIHVKLSVKYIIHLDSQYSSPNNNSHFHNQSLRAYLNIPKMI